VGEADAPAADGAPAQDRAVSIEYFALDVDGVPTGLLRRIRNAAGLTEAIEVVSGGKWVDDPSLFRFFEPFGGDQLDLIPLTEAEARKQAAALGVTLDEDDGGFAERGTWKPGELEKAGSKTKPAEYADLHGDELIERVMLDRDLSRASALDTIMLWNRPAGDVIELPPSDDEIVSEQELASLSDEELVRLIMERSSLDEERAREALAIVRGGPPADTIFEREAE